MSFEPEFLKLMTTTVTYKPSTGMNGFGVETFGTSIAIPAHITYKTKIIRGDKEESHVSSAQISIPPGGYVVGAVTVPTVSVKDHVTLPDGTDRRVLSFDSPCDESGTVHHQSISLT